MFRWSSWFLPVLAALGCAALGWTAAGLWLAGRSGSPPLSTTAPSKPAKPGTSRPHAEEDEYGDVWKSKDPAAQVAAAIALAARIPPASFARFLENLDKLPSHAAQGLAMRTVLRRWVAHDPQSALQWCLKNQEREMTGGVIQEWVQRDPANAEQILQNLPAPARAAATLDIFAGLVSTDRQAAVAWLTRLSDPEHAFSLTPSLRDLARQDPSWLLEQSESLPPSLRVATRAAAAQALAEADTAKALAWICAQPDRMDLLHGVLLLPSNEPALLTALAELPPDEQIRLPTHALARWGATNPDEMIDAVAMESARLSDPIKHQLFASVHQDILATDDPGRLAHRLLADPALRKYFGLDSFVMAWSSQNPEAARQWVGSLQNSTDRQTAETALSFASDLSSSRPPSASLTDQMIGEVNAGNFNSGARLLALNAEDRLAVLDAEDTSRKSAGSSSLIALEAMARQFPAETARWLQSKVTSQPDEIITHGLAETASQWAREEPQAAADWTASLPPGTTRAWTAANVAAQWHRLDPHAAQRWIDTLPPDEQSIASRGIPPTQ